MPDRLPWDQAVEEAAKLGKSRFVHDAKGRAFKTHGPKGHCTRGKPGVVVFGIHADERVDAVATCADCVHYGRRGDTAGQWQKCRAMKMTRGPGTDIRSGDPACARFSPSMIAGLELDADADEDCEICGGDGFRSYRDAPEEWGEDCPSEPDHLIPCRACTERQSEREIEVRAHNEDLAAEWESELQRRVNAALAKRVAEKEWGKGAKAERADDATTTGGKP